MKYPERLRTVYFIKPVGLDGPVKIGLSSLPRERLLQLAVYSPWPLEVVASAPGNHDDEQFLHGCFAESHSHREWFHSTQLLREVIAKVADGTSMADLRGQLIKIGNIRSNTRNPVPEYRKALRSYAARIRCASKKIRNSGKPRWHEPADVYSIIVRWHGDPYHGVNGVAPSADEIARLEEYLANPADHSVSPPWDRQKAAA